MNITIKEAAKLMGVSEQELRLGLQQGDYPIGTARKNKPGGKYKYYISPKLFYEFTGIKIEEIKKENTQDHQSENSL